MTPAGFPDGRSRLPAGAAVAVPGPGRPSRFRGPDGRGAPQSGRPGRARRSALPEHAALPCPGRPRYAPAAASGSARTAFSSVTRRRRPPASSVPTVS